VIDANCGPASRHPVYLLGPLGVGSIGELGRETRPIIAAGRWNVVLGLQNYIYAVVTKNLRNCSVCYDFIGGVANAVSFDKQVNKGSAIILGDRQRVSRAAQLGEPDAEVVQPGRPRPAPPCARRATRGGGTYEPIRTPGEQVNWRSIVTTNGKLQPREVSRIK